MVENKEKKIDEFTVCVTQFPARAGWKMHAKLIRIFGPVIGSLIAGNDINAGSLENTLDSDFDLSGLGTSLEKLFGELDENTSLALVFELFNCTRIDGQEISEESFDLLFAGKYLSIYKILGFVLEVNYGSFFGENDIGTLLKKLKKA